MVLNKKLNALAELTTILNDNGVVFWLGWGAALGLTRDGKLISWDKDIDVKFWAYDREKVMGLCKQFKDIGFSTIYVWWGVLIKKDGLFVDCSFYSIVDGMATSSYLERKISRDKKRFGNDFFSKIIWNNVLVPVLTPNDFPDAVNFPLFAKKIIYKYAFVIATKIINLRIRKLSFPMVCFTELKTVSLMGMPVKIPADAEKYLDLCYGKSWVKPSKTHSHPPETESFHSFKHGMEEYEMRNNLGDLCND